MAKQVINIGTAANDGTGDTNRDAFDKANDNFTELYDADAAHLVAADPHSQYALEAALGALASLNTVGASQIDDGSVSYAKMQDVSAQARFLGRKAAAGAGDPQEMTAAEAKTILGLTASDVSLGNVTNDAQTKAAVVPNTAPAAGNVLVGNAGATAYAPVAMSGDATLASTGAVTIANNAVTSAKLGELVYADAPNSNFNVGASTPVTLFSKSVAGIAAGDALVLDVWYTILNNSGGTKTYTPTATCGTLTTTGAEQTTVGASATNRAIRHTQVSFSISAANLGFVLLVGIGGAGIGANAPVSLTGALSLELWNTSTNDNTGTQTVSFTVGTSATGNTQTITLHRVEIRKVSQKL